MKCDFVFEKNNCAGRLRSRPQQVLSHDLETDQELLEISNSKPLDASSLRYCRNPIYREDFSADATRKGELKG